MGVIASLPEINHLEDSVFVLFEKSEKLIPNHTHIKGQLSYVEGGIGYITIGFKTYVIPAKHFFWIPAGIEHILKIGQYATGIRSLYYYTSDDQKDPFYEKLGIYPANELLIEMINYTEKWDEKHVLPADYNFEFLKAIKNMLPEFSKKSLPIILHTSEDEHMQAIIEYLEANIAEKITLHTLSVIFNFSERSLSRFFQTHLKMSFLQYLKTLRMIKAIELILKTNHSISDIAFSVGYSSLSSFSDTFENFTQSRPSDFRKN